MWVFDLYFPITWVNTVPVLGLFSLLVKHSCTESRSQTGFSISILTTHPSGVWEIATVANCLCHLAPKNIQWTSSNILSVSSCNFFTMIKILEWYYELVSWRCWFNLFSPNIVFLFHQKEKGLSIAEWSWQCSNVPVLSHKN